MSARRVVLGLACVIGLASCAAPVNTATPTQAGFQTSADLMAALQAAGAQVAETAKTAVPFFGGAGQVWQVGAAEIQVFTYPTVADRQRVSQAISADAHLVNGQPVEWPAKPNIWASGRLIVVYVGTEGGTILMLSGLLGDPLTQPANEQAGPYPPAVAAAIAAAAQQEQVDPGAIEVLAFEPAQWPDACLGVSQPGVSCAQVITPGWRISLRVNGQTVEMRTDEVGTIVRRVPAP